MHLNLGFRKLYQLFGKQTEPEKEDAITQTWEEIHRETVFEGIQQPLDLGISFSPTHNDGFEPEDIPF